MKGAILVSDRDRVFTILPGTKLTEVFSSFGRNVGKEFEHDPSHRSSADRNVEEYDRIVRMFQLILYLIPGRHVVGDGETRDRLVTDKQAKGAQSRLQTTTSINSALISSFTFSSPPPHQHSQ
jgi:hypothetical protein